MISKLEQKHKVIIVVELISAAALILFWAGYFMIPKTGLKIPDLYTGYPQACPAPDTVLVILLLLSAVLMKNLKKAGFLLVGLVAILFVILGIVGFEMQTESGTQMISMVSMLRSGFVNLWCIVFGLYFLLKLKKEGKK